MSLDDLKHKFIIRQLILEDIDAFFNLRLESLKNSPTSFLSSYEDEKKLGPEFYLNILKRNQIDNVIFGAYFQDKLIGIIGIYQSNYNRMKHKATLWGTYVNPENRKIGIAKKLMETVIAHAREKMKCVLINLCVGSDNNSAKRLYESFGKKCGTEPNSILIADKFYDEDHMILMLQDSQ